MMDKDTLTAIQKAVSETIAIELEKRLLPIQQTLNEIKELRLRLDGTVNKVDSIEKSVEDCSARMEHTLTTIIPALAEHVSKIAASLAWQTLDIDLHRRKWSLILQGISNLPNESEEDTRKAALDFAKEKLKVANTDATHLSACHRLSRDANSAIIVRFTDLADRERWLAGCRNLKGTQSKVSVSPDIPPVLRPIKKDLMLYRSTLPDEEKRRSHIRYTREWPYMELAMPNSKTYRTTVNKSDTLERILKLNPLFHFDINSA